MNTANDQFCLKVTRTYRIQTCCYVDRPNKTISAVLLKLLLIISRLIASTIGNDYCVDISRYKQIYLSR